MKNFKKFGLLGLTALTAFTFTACKEDDNSGEETYTYNGIYTSNILNWSPLDMQTTTDALIHSQVTDGFYKFNLSDDKTTYKIDCAMAETKPTDVTSVYAGKYEVPEGATASYAYRIKLRENLKFQDGKEITTEDYIESYKRLIDTQTSNYRSASYESGNVIISGSAYFKKNGQTANITLTDYARYDKVDLDEYYEAHKADKALVNWLSFGNVVSKTAKDGFEATTTESGKTYYTRKATSDDAADTETEFTLEEFKDLALELYGFDYANYALVNYTYRNNSFEETVGLVAVDDYTLDIISDVAVSEFFFMQSMTGSWLVDTELYDASKEYSTETSYKAKYNATLEYSTSFGPYKLVAYTDNKEFRLTRNENWYGYELDYNEGLYQTTDLYYQRMDESTTQLQSFLKGDLDEIRLNNATAKEYLLSDNLQKAPQMFTMEFFVNSNYDMLKKLDEAGTNDYGVLMSYKDFRKGLTFSVDRESFAATVSAGCSAEAMLYNNLYISDTATGASYRSTDAAKEAFKETYDGATTAADTYKPDLATELFANVYEEAVANGDYTPGANIKFTLAATSTTDEYTSIARYLTSSLTEILAKTNADRGTNFGTVTVELNGSDGANRYAKLLNGAYTMMWGGWGGSALSPYTFMNVWVNNNYNYCPGFNGETMGFSAKLSDMEQEEYHSFVEWYNMLIKGSYSTKSEALRTELLGVLEANFLKEYNIIPMYALTYFNLLSDKINYGTDTYVSVVEFGGIKSITYNYSDQAWEEYVEEHLEGGVLNYKD